MELFEKKFKGYLSEARLAMSNDKYKKFLEHAKGLVDIISSMEEGDMKNQLKDAVKQTLDVVKDHYRDPKFITMEEFAEDVKDHNLKEDDIKEFAFNNNDFVFYDLPENEEEALADEQASGAYNIMTYYRDLVEDGDFSGDFESFLEVMNWPKSLILREFLLIMSRNDGNANTMTVVSGPGIRTGTALVYYDSERDFSDYEYLD